MDLEIGDLVKDPTVQEPERLHDRALRPLSLDEYVGQDKVVSQLSIFIQAAQARGEALDHVMIFGPPGLGKTTLAQIIANEMGVGFKQTSGPVLERQGDLAALLTNLKPRDVLFIDEIHRLAPAIEEVLYPAMEDLKIDIMIGEGPAARSIKLDIPPFTLVGATTRAGMLTSPLRDRFGIVQRLQYYTIVDLEKILMRSARLLGIALTPEAAHEIAKRARGTPRIVNRLLRRVRDYAQVAGEGSIDQEMAQKALTLLEIDAYGLDSMDRKILQILAQQFQGGPAGLDSLAAALGESRDTLEDVIEPFLIQQGFLMRTARGRQLCPQSYAYLGIEHTKMEG